MLQGKLAAALWEAEAATHVQNCKLKTSELPCSHMSYGLNSLPRSIIIGAIKGDMVVSQD